MLEEDCAEELEDKVEFIVFPAAFFFEGINLVGLEDVSKEW